MAFTEYALRRTLAGAGILLLSISPMEAAAEELLFQDSFTGKLEQGWAWEREDATHWRTGSAGLEVSVQPGNMWGPSNNAKNVLLRSIPAPSDAPVEISVTFSNAPTAQWEQANLVWFYDDSNMVKLGQELVTGRLSIVMGREQNDGARTVAIVPLDSNTVELRLQACRDRVRGQFRTASWTHWRDVGECQLPVKGEPKASLHFYNGPPNEEHWVRVSHFAVRRLSAANLDWPRVPALEVRNHKGAATNQSPSSIALPGGFELMSDLHAVLGDPKADFDQKLFLNKDGSYGWNWNRRASSNKDSIACGAGWGVCDGKPVQSGSQGFPGMSALDTNSLVLECDAVTRLENDRGDHNLAVVIYLSTGAKSGPPEYRKISIWFDWYGKTSDLATLNDGLRDYGLVPSPAGSKDILYRIKGFRGMPPKVNLKAFVDAVAKLDGGGIVPQVCGIWFGNEIWDGSQGGTLVGSLNLSINGHRFSSAPSQTPK